ncbi:MAG: hypothetical protein HZB43_04405 [candidate division Zixibacteria bacterium]|nr:hypothetical protein [candidate division Zixibacteria bacterium]
MDLSEDGSTVLLTVVTGSEASETEVFDLSCNKLFTSDALLGLVVSPSGRYFCNACNELEPLPLELLDRSGKKIKEISTVENRWDCKFWNDTLLIVSDPDSLRLVYITTDFPQMAIPLNFERNKYSHTPAIAISRTMNAVAVAGEFDLLVLSQDGMEMGRHRFDDYLCAAQFDDSLPLLALQLGDRMQHYSYFATTSIGRADILKTSPRLDFLGRCYGPLSKPAIWLSDGLVSYWESNSAPVPAFVVLGANNFSETLFLAFDGAEGLSTLPIGVPGFYYRVNRAGREVRYVCALPSGAVRLISVSLDELSTGGQK